MNIKIKNAKKSTLSFGPGPLRNFTELPDLIKIGGPSNNSNGGLDIGINFYSETRPYEPEVMEVKEERNEVGDVTTPYEPGIPAREAHYDLIPGHTNHFTIKEEDYHKYGLDRATLGNLKSAAANAAIQFMKENCEPGYEFECVII